MRASEIVQQNKKKQLNYIIMIILLTDAYFKNTTILNLILRKEGKYMIKVILNQIIVVLFSWQ